MMASPASIVALLTDFGEQDEYVGVMKGVILSRAPGTTIVDICHQIAPQDVRQASAMIEAAFAYFPDHTLYLMVVDPGVGGHRGIVLAQAGQRRFLCPDNGLLTGLMRRGLLETAHRVTRQALLGDDISSTFHGRDIMAPAAGFLAAGGRPDQLGPLQELDTLVQLDDPPACREADGSLSGTVTAVDRFGNLITDIGRDLLTSISEGDLKYALTIQTRETDTPDPGAAWRLPLVVSYCAAPRGRLLATIGSRGTLEIAINMGSAAEQLGFGPGTALRVRGIAPDHPTGRGSDR